MLRANVHRDLLQHRCWDNVMKTGHNNLPSDFRPHGTGHSKIFMLTPLIPILHMPATWPSPAKKKSAVCQLAAENTQNKTQDLVKTRVNGL